MYLSAFTVKDKHVAWLADISVKDLEQREVAKIKQYFSPEETLKMAMWPLSANELQDSSEENTSFEGESGMLTGVLHF